MPTFFVQFAEKSGSGTTIVSNPITFTSGNKGVVVLLGQTGADLSPTSLVDGLGNVYNNVGHQNNSLLFGGVNADMFVCEDLVGGTTTLTGTFPYSAGTSDIYIVEYANLGASFSPVSAQHGFGTPDVHTSFSFGPVTTVGWLSLGSGGVTTSNLTDRTGGFFGGFGVMGEIETFLHPVSLDVVCNGTSSPWIGLIVSFPQLAPPSKGSVVIVLD